MHPPRCSSCFLSHFLSLHHLNCAAPAVSFASVGVKNAPTSGGATVTLSGLAFASINLTPTFSVATIDCATSAWTSGTTVQCRMSAASSGNLAYVAAKDGAMTVSSVSGTAYAMFSFDGELPRDFSLCFSCAIHVGQALIVGSFAYLFSAEVLTSTRVAAPALSRAMVGVDNAPTSGGATATLNGLAFAPTDPTPTASTSSVICATSSWTSGTTVACLTSSATVDNSPMATMTVAAVSGTALDLFSFDGANRFLHFVLLSDCRF